MSAREISEQNGIDIDLLQRLQRAVGLPRVEDPDSAVLTRVDENAFAYANRFAELGITPTRSCSWSRCWPKVWPAPPT